MRNCLKLRVDSTSCIYIAKHVCFDFWSAFLQNQNLPDPLNSFMLRSVDTQIHSDYASLKCIFFRNVQSLNDTDTDHLKVTRVSLNDNVSLNTYTQKQRFYKVILWSATSGKNSYRKKVFDSFCIPLMYDRYLKLKNILPQNSGISGTVWQISI